MNLAGSDLNLLRVFFAVVEANGVANAQAILNKDSSTISRALSQLEQRLNVRLCERGRQGFRLTPEGVTVHRQAQRLFTSLRGFEQTVESLQNVATGRLKLGIIDNIITDPACPLLPALRSFQAPDRDQVKLSLEVMAPEEMERQLQDKRLDLAIGIFESPNEHLHYRPLYQETDYLYAAPEHPAAADADQPDTTLAASRIVSRRFLREQELALLNQADREGITFTASLEAVAALILSGAYVGFLPGHYARRWLEDGELVCLDPGRYHRATTLQLATHSDSLERPIIKDFSERLLAEPPPRT